MFIQDLQRSGEWVTTKKTHLQRLLSVTIHWVVGGRGLLLNAEVTLIPKVIPKQSVRISKVKKGRRKRNNECGIDWQRGHQSGTQLSTEEMWRVEKLGKHNILVDTKYSAGTHQPREGERAMQHFIQLPARKKKKKITKKTYIIGKGDTVKGSFCENLCLGEKGKKITQN